ncbi:MAG: DUF2892 domain-containing protein [Salinivirgaceae bacterium]|nr:MAG: DUF2892 domain-containing protein [Salinivirgaceae bacterium]
MKKNIGVLDRVIRVLIALTIAVLYFMEIITGTLGIILLVVAGVFLITSITSFCGLYTIFGIRTCPMKEPKKE